MMTLVKYGTVRIHEKGMVAFSLCDSGSVVIYTDLCSLSTYFLYDVFAMYIVISSTT